MAPQSRHRLQRLSATEYCVSSSIIPTPVSVGLTLRRCNVRLMLRPVRLLALLYRSDLDSYPADEDVYTRAFPRPVTRTSSRV